MPSKRPRRRMKKSRREEEDSREEDRLRKMELFKSSGRHPTHAPGYFHKVNARHSESHRSTKDYLEELEDEEWEEVNGSESDNLSDDISQPPS